MSEVEQKYGLSESTVKLLQEAKFLSKVRGGDQDERKKLIEEVVEIIKKELNIDENS
jgi:hypothetical protein